MFLPIGFYNGQFDSLSEIKMPVDDLGIQRGYAVFDFLKLKNLTNPWANWYMDRLEKSCELAGLQLPITKQDIITQAKTLLSKNQLDSGYVKIFVSAGPSVNGFSPGNDPSILMVGLPLSPKNPKQYTEGAALQSVQYVRDLPEIKSINYMRSVSIMRNAPEDVVDILYYDNDIITETSRCNFFVVKTGKAKTPGVNILPGVTRRRILELQDIHVEETELLYSELNKAEEVFISSTSKGIMPIIRIDHSIVGDGQVGPVTKSLMEKINHF